MKDKGIKFGDGNEWSDSMIETIGIKDLFDLNQIFDNHTAFNDRKLPINGKLHSNKGFSFTSPSKNKRLNAYLPSFDKNLYILENYSSYSFEALIEEISRLKEFQKTSTSFQNDSKSFELIGEFYDSVDCNALLEIILDSETRLKTLKSKVSSYLDPIFATKQRLSNLYRIKELISKRKKYSNISKNMKDLLQKHKIFEASLIFIKNINNLSLLNVLNYENNEYISTYHIESLKEFEQLGYNLVEKLLKITSKSTTQTKNERDCEEIIKSLLILERIQLFLPSDISSSSILNSFSFFKDKTFDILMNFLIKSKKRLSKPSLRRKGSSAASFLKEVEGELMKFRYMMKSFPLTKDSLIYSDVISVYFCLEDDKETQQKVVNSLTLNKNLSSKKQLFEDIVILSFKRFLNDIQTVKVDEPMELLKYLEQYILLLVYYLGQNKFIALFEKSVKLRKCIEYLISCFLFTSDNNHQSRLVVLKDIEALTRDKIKNCLVKVVKLEQNRKVLEHLRIFKETTFSFLETKLKVNITQLLYKEFLGSLVKYLEVLYEKIELDKSDSKVLMANYDLCQSVVDLKATDSVWYQAIRLIKHILSTNGEEEDEELDKEEEKIAEYVIHPYTVEVIQKFKRLKDVIQLKLVDKYRVQWQKVDFYTASYNLYRDFSEVESSKGTSQQDFLKLLGQQMKKSYVKKDEYLLSFTD